MSALRKSAIPIGIAAAFLLFLLVNPWLVIDGTVRQIVTVAFWLSFIVLLIALFEDRNDPEGSEIEVEGPRIRSVPLQQHAGGSLLAAHPPVRRLLVARGRLAQVHRS